MGGSIGLELLMAALATRHDGTVVEQYAGMYRVSDVCCGRRGDISLKPSQFIS